MKSSLLIAGSFILLASCNGTNKQVDTKKIKESITAYLSTAVDKKDLPKIDSISLGSIDSLTEKNCMKIELDRYYNLLKNLNGIYDAKVSLIKADSALLGSLQQQADMYKKHNEKFYDASLQAQKVKMHTDSSEIAESLQAVQKAMASVDSISKLYANADSVAFSAWYVGANVYMSGGTQEPGNYIISKDWKVRR